MSERSERIIRHSAGMSKRVVVLDYGSGNLRSAERALERAGADVTVTDDLVAADRKSTRQNSSHYRESRMPSSA